MKPPSREALRPGGVAFLRAMAALATGSAMAALLFWALVNVPESNVFMLGLSALLVVLVLATAGVTIAVAAAFGRGSSVRSATRGAIAALPGFVAGLAVFTLLWWITGAIDGWWRAHQGEVDALFLRYVGWTGTAPLHRVVYWLLWLARWAVGLSGVLALTAAASLHGPRGWLRGLTGSLRAVPMTAAAAAVVIVGEGLWRLAVWRPGSLPATWVEPAFAVTKLVVLYGIAVAIAASVVGVYAKRSTADQQQAD
jgi:hypothetical protein